LHHQKNETQELYTSTTHAGGDLSFLELNLRAITTYQFNPAGRFVHNINLSTVPLEDIANNSRGDFDIDASYTKLMRKEFYKSRRLTFSTGLYPAEFDTCINGDCSETANLRTNLLQLRISYGWQF
jgi:hypothetical protein